MKFKLKKDRKRNGRLLVADSDKGDVLDYADAELLRRGGLSMLLPLDYEKGKKSCRFSYEVSAACDSLTEALREPISTMQFRSMLSSFLQMVRSCEENDLSRLHVLCDPDYVFYDKGDVTLRFAYIPIRVYASPVTETDLLAKICEQGEFAQHDQGLADAVLDYARRTAILTSVAFEDFLREQGLIVSEGSKLQLDSGLVTDTLDTRTSFGFDFVRAAQQEEASRRAVEPRRFLLVRLSQKTTYALEEGSYTLGRSPDCSIQIDDANGISRNHARIVVKAADCTACDLGSTNGTFINGRRIAQGRTYALAPGDRIALAHEEFELV